MLPDTDNDMHVTFDSCNSLWESTSADDIDSDLDDPVIMQAVTYAKDSPAESNIHSDKFRAQIRSYEATMPANRLSDKHFIRSFRMTPSRFEKLLLIVAPALRPKLPPKAIMGRASTKYAVLAPVTKLQISLRMLAGGSYLDLMRIHKVSHQTLYNSFQQFFCFVASGQDPDLRLKFPSRREELKKKARGFQRLSGNTKEMYGCVGALDGLQVKIKKPSRTEVPNVLAYCGRTKTFSINVQAICDADLRYTFVSVETPGATHDNTAFTGTDLADQWDSASADDPYWLAGDEAYSTTHNLVTPWPGRLLSGADRIWKDSFNYHFSAGSRNTIERSFGVLVTKWGIFWRPLEFHLEDVPRIILTAFALHNFCISDADSMDHVLLGTGPGARRTNEPDPDLSFNVVTTSDYMGRSSNQRRRDLERCAKRDAMTMALKRNGILRPRFMHE